MGNVELNEGPTHTMLTTVSRDRCSVTGPYIFIFIYHVVLIDTLPSWDNPEANQKQGNRNKRTQPKTG